MSTVMTLVAFIRAMYGEAFPGFLSLWSKQTKQTRFFGSDELGALEDEVRVRESREDLYLALGTQAQKLASDERGSTSGVVCLPGLFADIDFVSPNKVKANYPRDADEAFTILSSFPVQPTFLLETGGGLHAHYQFDSALKIVDDNARAEIASISTAFQRRLGQHFQVHGRDIDRVGDLTRLYRPPGTSNHKTGEARQVRLLGVEPARRLSISKVKELVQDMLDPATSAHMPVGGARPYPPAEHQAIYEGCSWYRDIAVNGAATCDEPNWHAAASITSRCENGDGIFHSYSRAHPNYSQREAHEKLKRALKEAGPRTCKGIEYDLGHKGCAECPTRGQITSPIQLGIKAKRGYDPGDNGPIPMGFLSDGRFVFYEQTRRILVPETSNRLLNQGSLLNLAPASFWHSRFSNKKGEISAMSAGVALMDACRARGGFDEGRVRGRGGYLDRGRVIRNFGEKTPEDSDYAYVCFLPFAMKDDGVHVASKDVLGFFRLFNWEHPGAAYLMLGWVCSSVICGALDWRTHVFLTGAKNTGKTTLVSAIQKLLDQIAVALDGQSTEAGIRQKLGPDSRPVVLDEFESDQNVGRMKQVIKLIRSSSSGGLAIARGTPEGRALEFTIRSSFLLAAINSMAVTAADRSRIVPLALNKHDNDKARARQIAEAGQRFEGTSANWCLQIIDKTAEIRESIATLQRVFPPSESRHALNMSTLLGAAWTMLNGRPIDEQSAEALLIEHSALIQGLGEAHGEDDAEECLNALLEYRVREMGEDRLLGHLIAYVKQLSQQDSRKKSQGNSLENAANAIGKFGLKPEKTGLLVANSHRGLSDAFRGTQWEAGNWGSSLKRLPGATQTTQRRFAGDVRSLGTLVPWELIPDQDEVESLF